VPIPRVTEAEKQSRVAALVEELRRQANSPPVRFVADVPTAACVGQLLDYFGPYAVEVVFFVPDDPEAQVLERNAEVEVNRVADADVGFEAAVLRATQEDRFVLTFRSCDAMIGVMQSAEWFKSHKVAYTFTAKYSADGTKVETICPVIPLQHLPKKLKNEET